ncbi:MAG: hypothetical protein II306_05220 [Clostridia bacterium]|nr:hypothetical protein [Clostridia bacterium]MEE1023861.1 DUF6062 family protein [Acutalibacteraceae bacterium]
MRDDICSIPVSDVFEPKCGCPVCRLRDMLKQRMVDYILGAAMMEPDVRQKTNEMGFCREHLTDMMNAKKRLPLALVLETHLDYLKNDLFKESFFKPSTKKQLYKTSKIESTCFVCDRIEWGMERILATMFKTYSEQLEFRQLFNEQEYLCLVHYRLLLSLSSESLDKKTAAKFNEDIKTLCKNYLSSLYDDVHQYTKMFDYRNSSDENKDWGSCKDSIERTYEFLCAENAE